MFQEHRSESGFSPQEYGGRSAWFSPLPVIALCARVKALLESDRLPVDLQHLEVTDDDDSREQYVAVLLKVKGRLDGERLKRQFALLIQNYNRDRQRDQVDDAWIPELLEASPLSLINLTACSATEHRAEIFRYILKHAQGSQAATARTHMHTYALRLPRDMHFLLLNLWQRVPGTLPSTTVMQDLCKVFSARTLETTAHMGRAEETDTLLTFRELEMVRYLAEGYSNREIARCCCIAEGTVKRHLNNIYSKLDARSRTQAIARMQALHLCMPITSDE